ncbi:hypothetical protein, partial [Burkholderia cenocepacia]|uniref:hypothetical protein n=1 Tax=Burkholderia cenocepacia TaxID=95486 RepID=UPI001E2BFD7D
QRRDIQRDDHDACEVQAGRSGTNLHVAFSWCTIMRSDECRAAGPSFTIRGADAATRRTRLWAIHAAMSNARRPPLQSQSASTSNRVLFSQYS